MEGNIELVFQPASTLRRIDPVLSIRDFKANCNLIAQDYFATKKLDTSLGIKERWHDR